MEVGLSELMVAVLSGSFGTVLGTAGGAYGATMAVKRDLRAETDARKQADTEHALRTDRLEQRVGVTQDGSLTGNGLITTTKGLADAVLELQMRD